MLFLFVTSINEISIYKLGDAGISSNLGPTVQNPISANPGFTPQVLSRVTQDKYWFGF